MLRVLEVRRLYATYGGRILSYKLTLLLYQHPHLYNGYLKDALDVERKIVSPQQGFPLSTDSSIAPSSVANVPFCSVGPPE